MELCSGTPLSAVLGLGPVCWWQGPLGFAVIFASAGCFLKSVLLLAAFLWAVSLWLPALSSIFCWRQLRDFPSRHFWSWLECLALWSHLPFRFCRGFDALCPEQSPSPLHAWEYGELSVVFWVPDVCRFFWGFLLIFWVGPRAVPLKPCSGAGLTCAPRGKSVPSHLFPSTLRVGTCLLLYKNSSSADTNPWGHG